MKRTPLKRSAPPRKRRPGPPRRGPERDPKYLAWIRTQPCCVCPDWSPWIDGKSQLYPTEAAHIGPHGMSQKASDEDALPICSHHHRTGVSSLHKIGVKFWEFYDVDRDALIAEHRARYEAQGEK